MQDSKGYIWISTDGGLCKYNGKSVTVFDKNKGIFEGSTYCVREDKYGNIWCSTSQNRMLKIVNDSVQEAPMSKMFEAKLSNLHLNYFLKIEGDSIFTCSQSYSYYGSLTSKSLTLNQPSDTISYYQIAERSNHLIPLRHLQMRSMLDPVRTGSVCIYVSTSKGAKHLMIPFDGKGSPNWRVCVAQNNSGSYFFSYDNYLVKLNPDLSYTYTRTQGEVISLYTDKDGGLWAGTFKAGVYYFSDSEDINKAQRYLTEFSVSGICHDAEGGIWCTTLDKGVFYCRNKSIISYSSIQGLDNKPGFLRNINDRIFTSSTPNLLFEVKYHVAKKYTLSSGSNYLFSHIEQCQNGLMLSGRNLTYLAKNDLSSGIYITNAQKKMVGTAQVCFAHDNKVYAISYGNLIEILDNDVKGIKDPLESPGRSIISVNGNILVGLKDGLYKMDEVTYKMEKVGGVEGEVTRVLKTGESSVWICTKDNRLYHLEKGEALNFSSKMKLPGTRYYDVAEDKFGNVWIASNVGLISVGNQNGKSSISTYNSSHGLPSTIVYEVEVTDNDVYISTSEGLASFPLQAEISNFNSTPIYLNALSVNDSIVPYFSGMVLNYDENSLKFDFDVLCFKGHDGNQMFYNLTGVDEKSGSVEGTRIILDNLLPGKYELEVFAYNNDGIAGKDPVIIEFEILKPFWKQVWFIIAVLITVAIGVYLIVKRITNNFKRRETEKTRVHKLIAEYQLSALQAQMNPHFIFNAINSIQTYILENDTQIAYDYLAKFSKLVRMVLHNAKEKAISLEKEIELLTMYIELEQIRFENKFTLSFNVQKGLDTYQVQLPPMIIQPYVENAIWHGLMPLGDERKGDLKIEMFEKDREVHIIVEDNGIGREASRMIKKTPGHKSVAMELTKERVNVLKSIQGYESASIEIIDLVDDAGDAAGTRVKIVIPLN